VDGSVVTELLSSHLIETTLQHRARVEIIAACDKTESEAYNYLFKFIEWSHDEESWQEQGAEEIVRNSLPFHWGLKKERRQGWPLISIIWYVWYTETENIWF